MVELLAFLGILVPLLVAIFTFHHQAKEKPDQRETAKKIKNVLIAVLVVIIFSGMVYFIKTNIDGATINPTLFSAGTDTIVSQAPTSENPYTPEPMDTTVGQTPDPEETMPADETQTAEPTIDTSASTTKPIRTNPPQTTQPQDNMEITILVKQLYLIRNYGVSGDKQEYFTQYGFTGDSIFTVTVKGFDESTNTLLWTRNAEMVNPWEYTCTVPNNATEIHISGISTKDEELNMYFTGILGPVFVMYYQKQGIPMIKIDTPNNSMSKVQYIYNQQYRNEPAYERYEYIQEQIVKSLLLLPGDYEIVYMDGSSKVVSFTGAQTYDFTK